MLLRLYWMLFFTVSMLCFTGHSQDNSFYCFGLIAPNEMKFILFSLTLFVCWDNVVWFETVSEINNLTVSNLFMDLSLIWEGLIGCDCHAIWGRLCQRVWTTFHRAGKQSNAVHARLLQQHCRRIDIYALRWQLSKPFIVLKQCPYWWKYD